ncbi:ribbon-helix-helix protein, CopG family [Candidatus Woesearchaeota archaeon]|nr:ribbon-helix-helix protein, CopG family [Candidatus Woesearchaeota archaeon]
METVTFKLQEDVVKKIDAVLKPLHFSNRTEFIRESLREKLNSIEKDVVLQHLVAFKGSTKKRVSDKDLHEIRNKVAREYTKKFGIKLN